MKLMWDFGPKLFTRSICLWKMNNLKYNKFYVKIDCKVPLIIAQYRGRQPFFPRPQSSGYNRSACTWVGYYVPDHAVILAATHPATILWVLCHTDDLYCCTHWPCWLHTWGWGVHSQKRLLTNQPVFISFCVYTCWLCAWTTGPIW